MKIPIDKIIVGDRQRTDLGDPLTELASMSDPDVGQINPIIVEQQFDGSYLLIAGNRRLTKARSLGWTEITAEVKSGMSEVVKQKIEFIEDVERKDRSWQEKCTAVYKLHTLMRIQKMQEGKNWTVRAMAAFTGYEKSSVQYFLQVGEALLAVPRDEEIHGCENYQKAVAKLIERTGTQLEAELNRRRAISQATEVAQLRLLDGNQGNIQVIPRDSSLLEADPSQPVHLMDTTPLPSLDAKTVIWVHGYNQSFVDDELPEEWIGEARQILCFGCLPDITSNLIKIIHPKGHAVLWTTSLDVVSGVMLWQPYPLIWNCISVPPDPGAGWPFAKNYYSGKVLTWSLGSFDNPSSSTISAMEEDDNTLPPSVIDFSLAPLGMPTGPVTILGRIDPVRVAELGRVPIWYEPDDLIFERKFQALKAYYEQMVPNADVRLR